MEAAALHSRALMTTFQPQSIANMIWAYATLAHSPPPDFLTLLCDHALHELPNFSPQNISNTIWALATLKHTNRVPALLHLQLSFAAFGLCSSHAWNVMPSLLVNCDTLGAEMHMPTWARPEMQASSTDRAQYTACRDGMPWPHGELACI